MHVWRCASVGKCICSLLFAILYNCLQGGGQLLSKLCIFVICLHGYNSSLQCNEHNAIPEVQRHISGQLIPIRRQECVILAQTQSNLCHLAIEGSLPK